MGQRLNAAFEKSDCLAKRSLAHVPARRLSDQDIMPRYRMTPPVRGRPPAAPKRGALQGGARESGGKRARRPSRVSRPFAAAAVE
ncbi:MAG: hypothetical protein ACREBG_14935 [Pyrinomonadaceae bacterium]